MSTRRGFLESSILGSISLVCLPGIWAGCNTNKSAQYDLSRDTPARFYDGQTCWALPRAGLVPGLSSDGLPRVVVTMNTLDVAGSDVFRAMLGMHTDDLGHRWTTPREVPNLGLRYETIGGVERPVALSDFWPMWHTATKTLLGTGHTVVYTPDWHVARPRPRHTAYSVYNPHNNSWSDWQKLHMPDKQMFVDAGAGSAQRLDEPDGSVLLPISFSPGNKNSHVTVVCCGFDGRTLTYLENGNTLFVDNETRGLHEPSLTRYQGRYYLTIRNDNLGYVTTSSDGLDFEPIQPWRFDNGDELGSYNTQQHWVTHSNGLFLVYTRRGADNDHVFRHRAPLFMAAVDPERLCVLRETEQILVPERGARLGNFGVTNVSPNETWVTVAEWMQTWGPDHALPVDNPYGSDGTLWVARIHWKHPNNLFVS